MANIRLSMDAGFFSADVIARTAHRYTNHFFVKLACSDGTHVVTLTPKHDDIGISDIEGQFRNDALEERLRERIRKETADLHVSLVQAALRHATPTGSDR
jgi:His-Xaa-Ser system protein HxsD